MNGWTEGLARAMAYLEAHLTEDLDPQYWPHRHMYLPFIFKRSFMCFAE